MIANSSLSARFRCEPFQVFQVSRKFFRHSATVDIQALFSRSDQSQGGQYLEVVRKGR